MKKSILTGIKPTSNQLHIGNYFGAIKPILGYQNDTTLEIFFFVANMHALTQLHNGSELRNNTIELLKIYIACGVNTDRVLIYNHADIPAHAQLQRVLGCITNLGFMERMHAYKDAQNKGLSNEMSMGTFSYPILMAADILLYDIDLVPVGKDQKQHVEYARDIAQKFNHTFGETFKLPEPFINETVATVPGTDGRKMSKSYNNYLGLLDDESTIMKKIKVIPTDTKAVEEIKDPDTCNIYNIINVFLNEEEKKELRAKYLQGGLSYKTVKDYLFEKTIELLKPIQQRYREVDSADIIAIVDQHTEKVRILADQKIRDVYEKVGLSL